MNARLNVLLALMLLFPACRSDETAPRITVLSIKWKLVSSSFDLPDAIEVWEGTDENLPLKAWMAKIDLSSSDVRVEVLSSNDEDGQQSTSDFAKEFGACLVVNGGYFRKVDESFRPIGLLLSGGDLVHAATPGIFRGDIRYDVHRAAIGFDKSNRAEIGWVSSRGDSVFLWQDPIDNMPELPGLMLSIDSSSVWEVTNALSGGPALLKDGSNRITVNEEVFFGSSILDIHPRTAAGIGENGELFILVVDGRQGASRGVSLTELAAIMRAFGVRDALNLDGGGSSTLVVRNELLNSPEGSRFQREVVSAIAIHCAE